MSSAAGSGASERLPWPPEHTPLMLAPMQGLTNRGLRSVFGRTARPDVLFTEFVRVRPGAKRLIAGSDIVEATSAVPGVPLVVQLIGAPDAGVLEAAQMMLDRGVRHINLNMGCPFGRMASHLAGGGMFKRPETVLPMLTALRELVSGSLSVKTRIGYDDPHQLRALLPDFERAQIDFLIVHPRTVVQKYKGAADHDQTRALVRSTSVPIIANGDVRDRADAERVLEHTGAAGLMLGRGAISDPLLFERIRGSAPGRPTGEPRRRELAEHLGLLVEAYVGIFAGEAQVLAKLKETLRHIEDPDLARWVKKLGRAKRLDAFLALLQRAP